MCVLGTEPRTSVRTASALNRCSYGKLPMGFASVLVLSRGKEDVEKTVQGKEAGLYRDK